MVTHFCINLMSFDSGILNIVSTFCRVYIQDFWKFERVEITRRYAQMTYNDTQQICCMLSESTTGMCLLSVVQQFQKSKHNSSQTTFDPVCWHRTRCSDTPDQSRFFAEHLCWYRSKDSFFTESNIFPFDDWLQVCRLNWPTANLSHRNSRLVQMAARYRSITDDGKNTVQSAQKPSRKNTEMQTWSHFVQDTDCQIAELG